MLSKIHKIWIIISILFLSYGSRAQTDLNLEISAQEESKFTLSWDISESVEIPTGFGITLLSKSSLNNEWSVIQGPLDDGSFPKQYSSQISMDAQTAFYTLSIRNLEPSHKAGDIISSRLIKRFSQSEILASITGYVGAVPVSISNEVEAFEIIYWTPGLDGELREASGVAFLPIGVENPKSIISYQHGTLYDKADAPSLGETEEFSIGLFLAGTQHICFMADYLGFGASADMFHPYLHAESEANSTLDMLRAGTQLVEESQLNIPEKLFLLGYSQGGHSTMALHRKIELEAQEEFIVTGSIPMAGPQSMSTVMLDRILSDTPYSNPFYIAYLVWSYDQAYDLFDDISEYFVESVAEPLKEMILDGSNDGAINDILPTVPKQMFKPEVLEAFQNDPNHPFRIALELNDTFRPGWEPMAPIQMYHCTDDEVVPYQNSLLAKEALERFGGPTVRVIDPRLIPFFQDGSHTGCIPWALLAVNDWITDQL